MPNSGAKPPPGNYSYSAATVKRTRGKNGNMSSKTQAYLAACNEQMSHSYHTSPKKQSFPRLESVARISAIPLVETGLDIGEKIYIKIRDSNPISKWYLTKAEASLQTSLSLAIPAVNMLNGPISKIDKIICKSLDFVEQRVPSMYLPPEMMYSNAQDYMSSYIVKPVLRRADSVKQLGSAVLDSRVTAFAADKVDSVLDKADIYMDKYLPADVQDVKEPEPVKDESSGAKQRAVQTLQHADRFSRKLGRRISRRTLMEARALKEHTTEAIHVLVYVTELLVTDPKLAYTKACELWAELSKDEPDNQARPATLEQLIIMLTRESARRLVHLINFASSGMGKMPRSAVRAIRDTSLDFLGVASSLIQKVPYDDIKKTVSVKTVDLTSKFRILLQELQQHSMKILEQLALFIAGNPEKEKIRTPRCHLRNNHQLFNANAVINGVN